VADASLAMLEAPADVVRGVAFNVGSNNENYQVRDIATIVHETFPDCTIEYAEGAGPDPRSYRVDFTKLERALPDFATKWTAADGARELRDAFEQIALTSEAFEGDRYTRLKRLRLLAEQGRLDGDLRWVDALQQQAR
jgi:hypothetical protein